MCSEMQACRSGDLIKLKQMLSDGSSGEPREIFTHSFLQMGVFFSKEMKTHSGCIVVVSGSVHFTLTLAQSVLNLAGLKPAHWIASAAVWSSMQSSLGYRHIGTPMAVFLH